MSEARRKI